jgi:hypothetical protein
MTYVIETNAPELGALTVGQRRAQVGKLRRVGVRIARPLVQRNYGVTVRTSGTRSPKFTVDYRRPSVPSLSPGIDDVAHTWQMYGYGDDGLGFSLKPPKFLRKLTIKKVTGAVGKVAKKVGKVALKAVVAHPFLAAGALATGLVVSKAMKKRNPGVSPAVLQRAQQTLAMIRAKQAGQFAAAPTSSTLAPSDTAETPAITSMARSADTSMVEAGTSEPVMSIDQQSDDPVAEKPVLAPTAAGPAAGLSFLQSAGPLVLAGLGVVVLAGLAKGVRRHR